MLDNVMLMSVAAGLHHHRGDGLIYEAQLSKGSLAAFLGLAAGVMVAVVLDMMPSALLSNYKAATWGMVLGRAAIWCSDRWLGQKMQGPKPCWGWVI